jgi:hypothetical protein
MSTQVNPADSIDAGVDAMVGLLTEQRGLYERLAALSDSQRELITGQRTEQLLTVLAERQTVLADLERLAARIRPFQAEWPRLRARLSADRVQGVEVLLTDIQRLLGGILQKDRDDAQLLAARKQTTAAAVTTCGTGKRADAAYNAQSSAMPMSREWTEQ